MFSKKRILNHEQGTGDFCHVGQKKTGYVVLERNITCSFEVKRSESIYWSKFIIPCRGRRYFYVYSVNQYMSISIAISQEIHLPF